MVSGSRPTSVSACATRCAALFRIERLALDEQTLLDDLQDRQARRQRAVGILEDDLHVLAQRPHVLALKSVDIAARYRRSGLPTR